MNHTTETSKEALVKFTADEKKAIHYKIILDALRLCPYSLTGFGIAQRCKLTYHQVMRRTKELEEMQKIVQVGKKIDIDSAKRTAYSLIN